MSPPSEVDAEVKLLKSQLENIWQQIRQLEIYLRTLDATPDEDAIFELETRLLQTEPLYSKLQDIQVNITLHNQQIEQQQMDEITQTYFSSIAKAKKIISKASKPNIVTDSTTNVNSYNTQKVKLPRILLSTFDGDYNSWLTFKDSFISMIHHDSSIADIEKFHYLRSSLKDKALKIIENITPSAENYKVAWDLLCERFENKKLLVNSHLKALFDIPVLQKESSTALRNLYDAMVKNYRALENLQIPIQHWDAIIVHIINEKWDNNTKRAFSQYKTDEELPSYKELKAFLNQRCAQLEQLEYNKTQSSLKTINLQPATKTQHTSQKMQTFVNTSQTTCPSCNGNHSLYKCSEFQTLTPQARSELTRSLKICKNCLRTNHITRDCKSQQRCKQCNKQHHSLLHIENEERQVRSIDNNKAVTNYSSNSDFGQILLSTALVRVKDSTGKYHNARCLLDSGSQSNFITEEFCKRLQLPTTKIDFSVVGINSAISNISQQTKIQLTSRINEFNNELPCLVISKITENLPVTKFQKNSLQIPKNIILADPTFNEPGAIDILIGVSCFYALLDTEQKLIPDTKIILQKTKLGWIVAGNVLPTTKSRKKTLSFCNIQANNQLQEQLTAFWKLEEPHSNKIPLSLDEEACEKHFEETTTRREDGRFIVAMPFKISEQELGSSKEQAIQRFQRMEKKLQSNEKLRQQYVKFMQEYETMKHMTKIELRKNEDDSPAYYLPHHPIVREYSLTTKLRVVFDASAKTSSGLSLNDIQRVGPTLQRDVFSILCQFRQYPVVLTADIMKMYRQIEIVEQQRKFLRIFWRTNPYEQLSCYELNTVTYGTSSAPYLATKCLMKIAEQHEAQHPKISHIIKNSFYMDDLLTGGETISEVIQIQQELSEVLANAGFQLRKFLSNKPEVLANIKEETSVEYNVLQLGVNENTKTLGVIWNSVTDIIQYTLSDAHETKPSTKRTILSAIFQIYDPLGLIGPVLVAAKLLIQELWQQKLTWDEKVSSNIQEKWNQLRDQFPQLNTLQIPRHVSLQNAISFELHGFADASEKAYGACVYIRCTNATNQISSRLLCAKSRVAPLKKVSLPRLELSAALLLAQLVQKVKQSLSIIFNDTFLWSDSTITLCWIKASPNRWKTFVANRVAEIQSLTNLKDWHHISSPDNPADELSRGTTPSELIASSKWWRGPSWLSKEKCFWLTENEVSKQSTALELITTTTTLQTTNFQTFRLFNEFSNFLKLRRIVAYLHRFVNNTRRPKELRQNGYLTTDELRKAEISLIKAAQSDMLAPEIRILQENKQLPKKNHLSPLYPFIDENGILRVGGRLKHSNYTFAKRHPAILPKGHKLTRLIMTWEHQRLLHCGPSALLASVRERYWPISGRNMAKQIVRNCHTCFKFNWTNTQHLMGNLPSGRINVPPSPFHEVGVDYAGPFNIKDRKTRNPKIMKCYIALFVCYATKALHLELVSDLTTQAFIACLRRFVARRGKPLHINSDNGTNFVGASSELRDLAKFLQTKANQDQVINAMQEDNITWKFNPPRAPHFGGLWEAGVKAVKHHLKRILSNALLDFEEFSTVLTQIEGILNSRPLTALSSDPSDFNPLTPAHFLIGKSLSSLPDPDLLDKKENSLSRYQRMQQLVQQFWSRWSRDYISELQTRTKWKQNFNHLLKEGTLVLVREENQPPHRWKLGRVLQLHPGSDGVVRVVTIRTASSIMKRPVIKVCALPMQE